jgi:hypothetical protein
MTCAEDDRETTNENARSQTGKIYSNNYKGGSSSKRLINELGEVTESKSTPGDIRQGESHLRVGRCHG